MTSIRATIEGASEVQSALNRLSDALDPVHILDEASALILNKIRTRFKAETDPTGRSWAPLRPKTITRRIALGFGPRPILFNTGKLYNSIQLAADGPDSRVIKTDVEYAAYLQFGTDIMPARSFLGITKDDANLVTALIVRRVRGALG